MPKLKLKRFSPESDKSTKKFRVTAMDLYEFNAYIKGRLKTDPRLLKEKFNGDKGAYEDFMMEYQNRTFSEIKSAEDFRRYAHNIMKEAHGEKYDEEVTNKVVDDLLKNHKGTEYGELIGRLTSGFGEERSYSAEAMKSGVTFNLMPTDVCVCLPQLIGNILLSVTACHMYHLCTTDYAAHMALDEYYNEMPDLIDALAEHYIGSVAGGAAITLTVSITPGACPVEYLEALKAYCTQFSGEVASDYQSQIDAISEQIDSTLYKLKKLH